ncbi:MAG TPA: SAM-dependent methyltransferase [Kineosporiaceae bacterium]
MQTDDWAWVEEVDDAWVPPPMDTSKPSTARIYNYALGGKDHYLVDREVAGRVLAVNPEGREAARANRQFMVRVVRSMAESGIRQFIDLGTGIPISPNLHETAWAVEPGARIVYVDNDPVVLAHNRAFLRAEPRVAVLAHDLRDPAAVLADPQVHGLLDLTRPVGLLMVCVLHFVDVAAAPRIVNRYLRDLPPGSQVAISTATSLGLDPAIVRRMVAAYGRGTGATLTFRTEAEVQALFDGLEMVEPIADVHRSPGGALLGGVGVKR